MHGLKIMNKLADLVKDINNLTNVPHTLLIPPTALIGDVGLVTDDDFDDEKVKVVKKAVDDSAAQPQYWSGYTPKQQKDLEVVDHKKIDYQPFTKIFYTPVPEIARWAVDDLEKFRFENECIKVTGKNAPNPIKKWSQCGVSTKVLEILKHLNYEAPTPIQMQAIPAIMSGRDVLGVAKTGSGKTLAYLLPMFRHVMDQPPVGVDEGPICLIMCPTRE